MSSMLEHYTSVDEGTRLRRSGHGRLELLRTRELLTQLLPEPPARVLDVGGATGVNASWLSERGYSVHALREARRVLRAGGVVAAAAITRYMALLCYCADGSLNADLLGRFLPTIATGRYDPSIDFTDAYFHTPDELEAELRDAGFADVRVFGVEGPAWTAVDAADANGERLMESALLCARALEEDRAILPTNAHLLAVGRAR